jgi:hypothetical protein
MVPVRVVRLDVLPRSLDDKRSGRFTGQGEMLVPDDKIKVR